MAMKERSHLRRQIAGCVSPYMGISYVPPSQGTAQDSSHSPFLKSHATNQLVHGHVSWGRGVTPKYPLESLDNGVTLEILYRKQQGMDYLSQISSENQIRLCFSK